MEESQATQTNPRDFQLLADKNSELRYLRRLADKQASRLRKLEETLSPQAPREVGSLPPHYCRTKPRELLEAELGDHAGRYFALDRPAKYPLALSARPGKTAHELTGTRTATIGIAVFGLTTPELAAVVETIRMSQRRDPPFVPVFLTNSMDTTAIRVEGFVFEYFPCRRLRRRTLKRRDVDNYFLDKLRFLLMKWGITEVICFGDDKFPPLSA